MNKDKTRFIIPGAIGAVCLVILLVILVIKTKTVRDYKILAGQWNEDLAGLKVAPTPENIFSLRREHEWIAAKEKELIQLLLKKTVPVRGLTPLQFKEELLNAQTKLRQLSAIQGSKLVEDLGFAEYTAGVIPHQDEVDSLTKQLTVINELVNLLLKYKVSEINSITRMPGMIFKIEMHCSVEDLLAVMGDIVNAPYVLIVKNLKINKLDENKVTVEMLIGVCEFAG